MAIARFIEKSGNSKSNISLPEYFFDAPINVSAIQITVKRQLACARRGTASTRERAEIRGGGRKPWRQKGTGRARAGTNRSPIWVGGGTVFGPKPRGFEIKVNKKVRNLALRSALSQRASEERVVVVDDFEMEKPRTRDIVDLIRGWKLEEAGRILIVLDKRDENVYLSARNIQHVKTISVSEINTYDILLCDYLLLTESALKSLNEKAETVESEAKQLG